MGRGLIVGPLLLALCLTACGHNGSGTVSRTTPIESELRAQFFADLAARGIDPDRVATSAPTGPFSPTILTDLKMGAWEPSVEAPQQVSCYALSMIAGDCDVNGEVSVSDISRLAWWLNAGTVDALYSDPVEFDGQLYHPRTSTCYSDGDRNGLLGVSDVTSIGAHNGERFDGWHARVKWPGSSAFVQLMDPDQPGQPQFWKPLSGWSILGAIEFEVTQPGTTQFYVVPFDAQSGQEGQPSQTFTYTSNNRPIAGFSVSTLTPTTSDIVTLDASVSSDADGDTLSYNWTVNNFGGDAASAGIEAVAVDYTHPVAIYRFLLPGTYEVRLSVNDGKAYQQAETQTITVTQIGGAHAGGWQFSTVFDTTTFGWSSPLLTFETDLAEVAGRAGILSAAGLDVAYSSSPPDGSAWTAPAVAVPFHRPGYPNPYATYRPCLAEVAGRPAVSTTYYQGMASYVFGDSPLIYSRALDAAGASWPQPRVVTGNNIYADGLVGGSVPLLLSTREPLVEEIQLWTGPDPDGSNLAPFGVEYPQWFGAGPFTLLSTGSDYCIVSTGGGSSEALHSVDTQSWTLGGSVQNQISTANEWVESRAYIVGGRLALLWLDEQGIKYTVALDAAASQWLQVKLVATDIPRWPQGDAVGYQVGLSFIDGAPAIAYSDGNYVLKLVRATNSNGTAWDAAGAEVISSYGTVRDCDLEVVAGRPAVSFYNFSTQQVEYAWQP